MSILFSGDFHGNVDRELSVITKNTLLKKYSEEKYKAIKYHIILGDGGFLWPGDIKGDIYNFRALAIRHFPILCVIGNHEPMLGMSNLPEVDIGIGEKVIQIWAEPFTAYLKRGKIYNIDGIKFLVLGGALSIDRVNRTLNKSWWENEYWSEQEKYDLFKLLETDNTFDYVISHTGPQYINYKLFGHKNNYFHMFIDEVALLNDEIHKRINFREWWCGHWHRERYYYDKENHQGYQYIYKTTKILTKMYTDFHVYNEFDIKQRDFFKGRNLIL